MSVPIWQWLLPKYGNYGGPGWSGGALMENYNQVNWDIEPADSLDSCFFRHDKLYQRSIQKHSQGRITEAEKEAEWIKADIILIEEIEKLPINPYLWEMKPTLNSYWYAWLYRKLAIGVFRAKVKLLSCSI